MKFLTPFLFATLIGFLSCFTLQSAPDSEPREDLESRPLRAPTGENHANMVRRLKARGVYEFYCKAG
ncbi:MAG: hypothetical protein A2977_02460 [Alphaproteobacteria bacterium RIFCSPLOWO2_01_FULL_45_8]|nr:MAG: hypothetical protein A3K20_00940 [Alphaproteobacteria bacterium GWA1_45_9]OFW89806.1 MAG: hypothetical protein A2621_02830 [Alphaproteobacteria bacterium RIFCSPHIGHO2_01_FULL_41_14]OFW95787.1 MAG: hypothetical protein A2977_02460 [Alphaproteobacteria bacterium RIFCSPLOWO2_01_FULL_45_8]HCI48937.1 hypothetical protein [Holosporales bacterium]